MSFYDEPVPRRPVREFNDALAAAYQAGRADAEAERFTTPAFTTPAFNSPPLSSGLEPGLSRRGSGFVEEDHRSLPRRPAIIPPRPGRIRRSSTLPVRFEDEVAGRLSEEEGLRAAERRVLEEERRVEERARMEGRVRMEVGERPPPPPPPNPSWYLRDQERARQKVKRGSVDSLGDGESGGEERERLMKRIVVEEGQGNVAKESKGKRAVSPSSMVSDDDETKDADTAESGSSDGGYLASEYPRKGKTRMPAKLVSTAALSDLGYAFEVEAAKHPDEVSFHPFFEICSDSGRSIL
jgi:hypothetical protein